MKERIPVIAIADEVRVFDDFQTCLDLITRERRTDLSYIVFDSYGIQFSLSFESSKRVKVSVANRDDETTTKSVLISYIIGHELEDRRNLLSLSINELFDLTRENQIQKQSFIRAIPYSLPRFVGYQVRRLQSVTQSLLGAG